MTPPCTYRSASSSNIRVCPSYFLILPGPILLFSWSFYVVAFFFFFWPHSMWDLSSLTRDRTHAHFNGSTES